MRKSELVSSVAQPSKKISSSLIEDMLEAVDIVDIMEQEYGIAFQVGSQGWVNACCPFPDHIDKSPSFGANSELGIFKCFGCHRQGNLIKFIRTMEGLSFPEAVHRLSLWSGINQEEGGRDVARAIRDIKAAVEEYLNRQGETALPGGLSEVGFLLTLSKRLRTYESKVDFEAEELAWVDSVYKKIDDLLVEEDYKSVRKIWTSLAQEIPTRVKQVRTQ